MTTITTTASLCLTLAILLTISISIAVVDASTSDIASTVDDEDDFKINMVFSLNEAGYKAFRIPGLISFTTQANKGINRLVAFAEGRKYGCGDWDGEHDIVAKISDDGGETWGDLTVVVNAAEVFGLGHVLWDPTPVYDNITGELFVLFAHSMPGQGAPRDSIFYVSAKDDGLATTLTWSGIVNITDQIYDDKWHVGTPADGCGIQLSSGRLLVPAYHDGNLNAENENEGPPPSTWESHTLYSDDHGKTWKHGETGGIGTCEGEAIELESGQVYYNARYQATPMDCGGGVTHCRAGGYSNDDGITWSNFTQYSQLPDPACKGGLTYWPKGENGNGGAVVLTNCRSSTARDHLTLSLSFDDGKTWDSAHSVEIYEQTAGYSTVNMVQRHTHTYEGESDVAAVLFEVNTCSIGVALVDLGTV